MKVYLVGLLLCCALQALVSLQSQPALTAQQVDGQKVQVSWPASAADFTLEQSAAVTPGAIWQPITAEPLLQNNRLSVTFSPSLNAQFFRLREAQPLTTITSASPGDGETGVAVTRETIVQFSSPLAANTVLTANNFYAGSGGRRFLSRIALSSDRMKATLFYLEPLAGSSRVYTVFDGAGVKDERGRLIDPDGDGAEGGSLVIGFDTVNVSALPGTAVVGTVFASELAAGADTGTNAVNKPLAGVTITVDGMEQTLRATTDANGNFTLSPVPPGRFFVHIDGRTVVNDAAGIRYPSKSYYPFVGKGWEAVAGRTNNLAGGTGRIYLPLITAGTLQPVSLTNDTVVTFPAEVVSRNPALAGVSITVPANSLFSDNGTRGGKVGIAPVPPDRLPGPLPPGLEAAIVITVQTDGALNFDKPAPICFPNLPDPVLNTLLPPGSKQALVSFNHDKGIWEAVGSMTVSADGKMICSDPGEGVLQPGWHVAAPVPDTPPPPPDNPCRHYRWEGCEEYCLRLKVFCLESAMRDLQRDMDACLPVFPEPTCTYEGEPIPCPKKRDVANCQIVAAHQLDDRKELCNQEYLLCLARCRVCKAIPPSLSLSLASGGQLHALASGNEPASDQLREILDQTVELIRPLALDSVEIPADKQEQIIALLQQADRVAGGDSGAFLRNVVLARERELAAYATSIGTTTEDLNPGNAPGYPVLYAATIFRPSGRMIVRGETAPFGQYSIFVPRDGRLVNVSFYDPKTKQFALITPNRDPNARFRLPRFTLSALRAEEPDFDQDGLPDAVEGVYGTDPLKRDSDGDGIPDGGEVEQGTDPLDGLPVRTGILGSARLIGNVVDVWAGDDLVVTADVGVSVFNVVNGMNPVLIAQVRTPGVPQRVGVSGKYLAVAAREGGLIIIDIGKPADARVMNQLRFGEVTSVVASGGIAYVGQTVGTIKAVELASGRVLSQVPPPGPVRDLALADDHLYAITDDQLVVLSLAADGVQIVGSVKNALRGYQRLFVGGGTVWATHRAGYDTYDVRDAVQPRLLVAGNASFFGWSELVPNGSAAGLGVVQNGLLLYDLSNPGTNNLFVTKLETVGRVFSAALFNGLAYAGGESALHVVNYLAYDANRVPPVITLETSALDSVADTGRQFRVTANAVDDIQVRNVEFYIDGQRTAGDGNFPFEYRFDPPLRTATKTNFTVRARAVDSGGNSTWSDELTIQLGPDVTLPRIVAAAPLGGAKVVTSVSAQFNEQMNPAGFDAASFRLIAAGEDGLFQSADDLQVTGGALTYQAGNMSASLNFAAPLGDGLYRAVVTTAVRDTSGNQLARDYVWEFRVANAVFWSSNADGTWEDAWNWSTGTVPGPGDDIFIESIPGDVTIFDQRATRSLKRLSVAEHLIVSEATWRISEAVELREFLTATAMTIQGGTIKQVGNGKLFFGPNVVNTLDGIRLEGDLELTNTAARAVIRNGLVVSGRVVMDNSGVMAFSGNQTLDNCLVDLAGNSAAMNIDGGTTLTLGPGTVIRGKTGYLQKTAFSTNPSRLINKGRIVAEVAGGTIYVSTDEFENAATLEAMNGGALTLQNRWNNGGRIDASKGGILSLSGTWTNRGTINATDAIVNLGGTFALSDLGAFNRTGGTVILTGVLELGGGTLALDQATGPWRIDGGTLRGGTVKQNGEGKLICAPNGENVLDAMRIEGDLDLGGGNSRAQIRNGLTLAGTALLKNTGAMTFKGDQTFHLGEVVFEGLSNFGIEPGTTLTLAPSVVLRGKDGIIGNGVFAAFGTRKLINQGLISSDVPGGTLTIFATETQNDGTLRADGPGTQMIIRSNPFTDNGQIEELNGGKVLMNP